MSFLDRRVSIRWVLGPIAAVVGVVFAMVGVTVVELTAPWVPLALVLIASPWFLKERP